MTELYEFDDSAPGTGRTTLLEQFAIGKRKAPPFWGAFLGIGFFIVLWSIQRGEQDSMLNYVGCFSIVIAGLFPAYLWSKDPKRVGLPIFPIHAGSFVWAFGMPLLDRHPGVLSYSPDDRLGAAMWVVAYLVVATALWWRGLQRPLPAVKRMRMLSGGDPDMLFMGFMAFGTLWELSMLGGWLSSFGDFIPLFRSVASGCSVIGIMGLSHKLGQPEWPTTHRVMFISMFAFYLMATTASLFLVGGLAAFAAAVLGFTMARNRVPWLALILGGTIFGVLHLGKEHMRLIYWTPNAPPAPTVLDFPEYFGKWINHGIDRLEEREDPLSSEFQSSRTLVGRASLFHMFLLTYTRAGDTVPFLYGETYKIIPALLVPRVFWPDKPRSHEGTYLLNIEYGLQEREATLATTIGWGTFNEAWANFGGFGLLLLAWFNARVLGTVEKLSRGAPIHSLRAFLGFSFCMFSLNTEAAMSIFITASFQASVALLSFLVLMRSVPVVFNPNGGVFSMYTVVPESRAR